MCSVLFVTCRAFGSGVGRESVVVRRKSVGKRGMCSVIRINGDVAFLIVMFSFSTFFDFIYFGWLAAAESVSWSDPYLGCRRLCIFVGKRCLRHLCACVLSVVLICWVYFWWRSRGARCHAKIWVILFLLGEKFYFLVS